MSKQDEKAFSGRANHFILNFPNGNRISTTWRWGSYTENYGAFEKGMPDFDKALSSDDVEVMVSCSDKLFKKLQRRYQTTNTVFGHITIKQWLKLVNDVSSEPKLNRKVS